MDMKAPDMTASATKPVTTAITEMFGVHMPVVAGGLMWLSNAEYVAASAKAGIIGFITAASFPDPDDLRAEIRKCRDLCGDAPFGVNVSMLPKLVPGEKTADVFRLIADEGVRFVETSGRNPEEYMPILKGAGIKVLHKVPAVRYAMKAQSVGVDAVAIVGAECGGHPGLDMIGSFVNAAMAERDLEIPYIIGGGVGTGSQIVAALAMGASGVVIGTRFLVASEIWAHEGFKRSLVEATERDTALTLQSVRNTVRSLKNETTDIVSKLEAGNPEIGIEALLPYVAGKIGRQAYETGDASRGILSAGHSLTFTDKIQPLAEIVGRLEVEMADAFEQLDRIR
jgi:NADH:quinone reductase (non-electrogenic)